MMGWTSTPSAGKGWTGVVCVSAVGEAAGRRSVAAVGPKHCIDVAAAIAAESGRSQVPASWRRNGEWIRWALGDSADPHSLDAMKWEPQGRMLGLALQKKSRSLQSRKSALAGMNVGLAAAGRQRRDSNLTDIGMLHR